MRTTISIDDGVLATAKHLAAGKGMTLGEYLEEGARRLNAHEEARPARRLGDDLPTFRGELNQAVDWASNRSIYELMYAPEDDRVLRIVRGEGAEA